MRARLDLGIGDGVDRGEFQRAEEAADQQDRDQDRDRHAGREDGAGGEKAALISGIDDQDAAEAEAR